ncbi:UDP-glucose dehydrogenase family protein [Oecophyllibacter saccharovorans]|uniref:UDP-glucose dehydrogenase family protein n=1 Tax=Oecophyllibacter saccharovorans TaxID=2558360 RepID=UPI00116D1E8C|nr:UDP-glucose/GDP-mannose dehydrogenase family protein [Oecophyllibacter saccharovorans]TPW35411.1 UDP-glucose/GDP-mannose dehydrogenase family protein [Oecophyllibacter saccharovorans]
MIGGGYVGLVSGACLAAFGAEVTVIEQDPARFARLQIGDVPIYEPGLAALLERQRIAGRLSFCGHLAEALPGREAVFIAVGTPARRGSGHADLRYVSQVVEELARCAENLPDGRELLVVMKSTVPVGTGRDVARKLAELRPDLRFTVASNPEFLREGEAINDFMQPDRVVIGLDGQRPGAESARAFLTRLYCSETSALTPDRLAFMGLESAELTKYAANAFLALKVTFINEMADLCEASGGVIEEVARGMGLDPRIGAAFLQPGPGYGGSCFPKDTRALATTARQKGTPMQLVETTIATNEARKRRLAERILTLAATLRPLSSDPDAAERPQNGEVQIAVLGLAFKAGTDDMRDAPALTILPLLLEAGARLHLYDPQAMAQARTQLGQREGLMFAASLEDALAQAELVVVLTEWPLFRALTPQTLARLMPGRLVIDCRNLWSPEEMRAAGFAYHRLGRGAD